VLGSKDADVEEVNLGTAAYRFVCIIIPEEEKASIVWIPFRNNTMIVIVNWPNNKN